MGRDLIVRASGLGAWADCARRAATTIFRKEIVAAGFNLRTLGRSIGAAVGTATHAGAASALTDKLNERSPAEKQAIDAAQAALDTSLGEAAVLWDDTTPIRAVAQQQVGRMVRTYINQVATVIQPVAVEQRLFGTVDEFTVLSGQKDVLTVDPAGTLADLKTGHAIPSAAIQLGAYSLLEKANGGNVLALRQDFVRRVKVDRPQPVVERQHYDVSASEDAARDILADIRRSADEWSRRIAVGALPPEGAFRANPMSYLCSDKWCPAWGTSFCRLHKKGKP